MFEELNAQWQALVARVSELENKVAALSPQGSPSATQGVIGPESVPAPTPTPYTPPPQAQATPAPQLGPTPVPTQEQLTSRLMDVNQAKGEQETISLIAAYGGKDEAGNIRISLVPQEQYAALYAAAGQKLGVH